MQTLKDYAARIAICIGIAAILIAIGAFLGYRYSQGREAVTKTVEVVRYVDRIVYQAATDTALATDQAVKRTKARTKAREITTKGTADANLKANPACDLDSVSFGLLNDAISTANGKDPGDKPVVPGAVRADELPGGPVRQNNPVVVVPSD